MEIRYEDPRKIAAAALANGGIGKKIEALGGWRSEIRETVFERPVEALAAWHLGLPAAPDHHTESGGAIRFALEAGWAALRMADGAVFAATEPSERRRLLEPQYRCAAWLAAIASTLHWPALRLEIASATELWDVHLGPLARWLEPRKSCQISWRAAPPELDRCLAVFAARWVLPDPMPFAPAVARSCITAIAPAPSADGVLARLVREALSRVEEADRRRQAGQWIPEPSMHGSVVPALEPGMQAEATEHGRADGMTARTEPPAPPAGARQSEPAKSVVPEPRPAAIDPACADLMRLLAERARDPAVWKKLTWERDGLAVPLSLLAEIGLSSEAALALLRRSGQLVKRDGRRFVLTASAGERVMPRTAQPEHA